MMMIMIMIIIIMIIIIITIITMMIVIIMIIILERCVTTGGVEHSSNVRFAMDGQCVHICNSSQCEHRNDLSCNGT